MKRFVKQSQRGFTLIELLVVIAVIGILAAVVLASLNSAREKGRVAAIKSNFKNMMSQAELSYDTVGNYSQVCTAIQPMMDAVVAIVGVGKVRCYVLAATQDKDWGVAATYNDNNYAVNPQGVVTFDTVNNGASMAWGNGVSACATAGKRLPSVNQLKALYDVYGALPAGFTSAFYWSANETSTLVNAYGVLFHTSNISDYIKSTGGYVRCVS